jgi:hypothetical protein
MSSKSFQNASTLNELTAMDSYFRATSTVAAFGDNVNAPGTGLQVGGGNASNGTDGTVFGTDGNASWLRIQPSKDLSPVELLLYSTSAQGIASSTSGTGNLLRVSGTEFSANWVGLSFYFGENVYTVTSVAGPSNLVVTPNFASSETEAFHAAWVQGTGTCNVAGTTVTRVTGDPFIAFYSTIQSFKINGNSVTVNGFTDVNTISISSSPGSLTNATFSFFANINDQLAAFRVQKMLGANEENLSFYARYDGYWMHSLYSGAGKYRKIVIGSGESVAGTLARQLVVQKNGDLSIAGDYEAEAIRVLNQTPANSKNRIETQAAPTGFGVSFRSRGADTNINFGIDCKGTGHLVVTNSTFGNIIAQFTNNWFQTAPLFNVANDAAAAALGVPVGGFYNTGGTVKQRLV